MAFDGTIFCYDINKKIPMAILLPIFSIRCILCSKFPACSNIATTNVILIPFYNLRLKRWKDADRNIRKRENLPLSNKSGLEYCQNRSEATQTLKETSCASIEATQVSVRGERGSLSRRRRKAQALN